MTKQEKLDILYMDIALRISQMSYSRRQKVGAVLIKDGNSLAFGWNGRSAGMDNNCEIEQSDGTLVTRPDVSHAEQNLFSKLVKSGGIGAEGSTLYTTLSPCPECAKQIKGAGILKVVYLNQYRDLSGIEMLETLGVQCEQLLQHPSRQETSTDIETKYRGYKIVKYASGDGSLVIYNQLGQLMPPHLKTAADAMFYIDELEALYPKEPNA